MPLWSNEDWRARIGSCWCALGRTFNTRFTRCRGKSQRDLSTHQAATMVIMMILFIATNMGLYVTRKRHKNLICGVIFGKTITELHLFRFGLLLTLFVPVLKFVVQMVGGRLPRKLKMSLKQFVIDLNDCLWFIGSVIRTFIVSPVLFVVNFTTGNISNVLGKISNHLTKLIGDRLSNGILTRSLVVVIIVTIQLLVSVVVARAIIFFLLLISGDVEQNRGPGHIDYSVTKELLSVDLETTAVQASLLLRCGDVESNPGPLTREGGVNHDVERSMNEVIKSGLITDSDRMFKDLALVIHDKFMEIGLELGLEYPTLCNELEVMKKGSDKAMKMLQLWKQSIIGDNFTYSVLATALEKHGHKQAAHKFCYTESKPQQCDETQRAYNGNNLSLSAAPIQSLPSNWTLYPKQNLDEGFDSVPDPKRRKLEPSQPPLGQVLLSTHDLQHIGRWRQMLVDSYLAQEHSTDAWPPLKIVKFIKFALVKEDKQAYHLGLETVQKDMDAVYGQKSNTSYENLFQNIYNGSLVLFEGRPGSGKTTLMVRASCDWGRENIFESKLVIFVRLRHLNKSRDVYLHNLLQVACPAFTPSDIQGLSLYIEGRLGEDVVFLLDGFDEYAPGTSDENYISKLILKMVYSRSIVILSSRPAATQRFRQNATLWIEIVGFMKEQVLQYINCYFEQNKEKSSSLIKHLEEHENLMNLCYLPLHCAMLVFLYNIGDALPETETDFYRDFTLSLLFRGIRKDKNLKPPHKLKSFDGLSDKKIEAFNKIGKLAFEATVAHQQVFEESEVQGICFNDSSDNEESLGLVVVDRYFAKTGIDETYTFLHLTLQEFLAAVFVSRLSESEQIKVIATKFVEQHLFVTSRFLFGILDYSKKSTKNLFKRMLDATNNAFLHHIQCAYESHSASACTDVVKFHDAGLKFEKINSLDLFCISYVLKAGEYDDIKLSFSECDLGVKDVFLLQGVGNRQLTIRLNNCDIFNSGLDKPLKHWPNLVKLELDYCHWRVSSVAEVLGEGLQHMTEAHHTTDQPLEITLDDCDINKEAVVGLLQAVGDRRLSLTIRDEYMCIDDVQLIVDALCLVTLPGLIELNVMFVGNDYENLTMGSNNLKDSTNLQKLNLIRLDVSNSGLEKALKHWPNLVKLTLDHCDSHCYVTSVAEELGEGLQHMTKAHHTTNQPLEITLLDCDFNEEAALGLLQAVGDRRLSLTITYYEFQDVDTANAQVLLDGGQSLVDAFCLVTLPGLIELNVSYDVEDHDLYYLTMRPNNLKHSTNLQKLRLNGLNISNSGLEKAIKHWPNLEDLILVCCKIDAATAVVLGESLQHTSKLQTLRLIGTDISNGLVEGLKHLPNLVKLNLSNNSIGDDGLHALSLPIKNYCKELKELWLCETQLTDRSITCLTEWIKVLNNLEKLNLRLNHFSEGGVKQIKEAVSERNTRQGVAKLELTISGQLPYH